ncbi:hypothetical protein ElyMa_001244500 [Elysia marginata]|uniref:Uncharacterized protein n=1 Tax=Elysia marginata TaxID=1093978 RepID=A0AAV4IA45_9GAST|nr:hypothetical protein ElyMa_001244500 [Elysia marginata]
MSELSIFVCSLDNTTGGSAGSARHTHNHLHTTNTTTSTTTTTTHTLQQSPSPANGQTPHYPAGDQTNEADK